jgi:uncharacterized damage-inducible protein DinB
MMAKVLLGSLVWLVPLFAQNNLTATATERYFNVVRSNLEESADAMPAEKYAFRLTEGQMSFAEWLIHSAQRNYRDCAVLKGESTPVAEKQAASLKEKAEVTQALKASFAYCAEALQQTTDQKAISSADMSYAFLHVVVHNNEIYGNVVGYLRVAGILPPSTARRQKRATP